MNFGGVNALKSFELHYLVVVFSFFHHSIYHWCASRSLQHAAHVVCWAFSILLLQTWNWLQNQGEWREWCECGLWGYHFDWRAACGQALLIKPTYCLSQRRLCLLTPFSQGQLHLCTDLLALCRNSWCLCVSNPSHWNWCAGGVSVAWTDLSASLSPDLVIDLNFIVNRPSNVRGM